MSKSEKKIVVETTGNFMLQDITNGHVIEAEGATEVPHSAFIDAHIENGKLKESSEAPTHRSKPVEEAVAESEALPRPEADGEEAPRKGRKQ